MNAYDFESNILNYLHLHNYAMMPSFAPYSSAAPAGRSFELACREWTMEKHSSVLEDELIEDAPGQSVSAGSTPSVTVWKVNTPVWLQGAYEIINNDLETMASVI